MRCTAARAWRTPPIQVLIFMKRVGRIELLEVHLNNEVIGSIQLLKAYSTLISKLVHVLQTCDV